MTSSGGDALSSRPVQRFKPTSGLTQLRSRAAAYTDRLLLKNSLRDSVIPLVLIEDTAQRAADPQTHVAPVPDPHVQLANRGAPGQSAMSYEAFVVTRIEELVEEAKRSTPGGAGTDDVRPTRRYAWPEIVALGVLGVAFAVSLAL